MLPKIRLCIGGCRIYNSLLVYSRRKKFVHVLNIESSVNEICVSFDDHLIKNHDKNIISIICNILLPIHCINHDFTSKRYFIRMYHNSNDTTY